jgi:hypothetical protein
MANSKSSTKKDSDSEEKIFDVARPGSSSPETGTKPMVIGHKTMASDPSILKEDAKQYEAKPDVEDNKEPGITLSPSKKLTLHPLNAEKKSDEDAVEESNQSTTENKSESSSEKTDESSDDNELTSNPSEKSKTTNEIEKERQVVAEAQEAKLQELIKSGKYIVDIKESHGFNFRSIITAFLFTGVILVVGLAVLIDLEIIDLGISLPFDIL